MPSYETGREVQKKKRLGERVTFLRRVLVHVATRLLVGEPKPQACRSLTSLHFRFLPGPRHGRHHLPTAPSKTTFA